MKKRLKNLRRLVAIKDQQRQTTQWKLARLEAEERAALADEAAIIAALNDGQPLHGLFVGVMAKHLRAASEQLGAIRQAKADEMSRLLQETAQLRRSEKMLVDVERRHGRLTEDKRLADLVEAATASGAASLPKASKAIL